MNSVLESKNVFLDSGIFKAISICDKITVQSKSKENMAITGINHINIELSAEQLPTVTEFYQDVLGLKPGFRAKSKRDGAWLYADSQPVIHLSVLEVPLTAQNTHFNHIAFACNGLTSVVRDLNINGIEYSLEQRSLADKEMTQIFFYDPIGIKIELNFPGETLPDL
jgi:catechol 2,3-dioxygenase-like lactoylglutathione lyase family enzyme